ncbi:MAG: VIT and VWA domain-containing protein [Pseudomonadota bacterium]
MKLTVIRRATMALLIAVLCPISANAAGLLTPANSGLGALAIKAHEVDVVIEDGYAITTVEQIFANPHDHALEAIYSFPIPEKAAVGEFTYWIDGQPVSGEVLEREQARDLYEQEKAQGRETALTEQNDHYSFESSVYPVKANDEVRVRMVYLQPVHTDLGIGRYVYPLEEGGTDEGKLAFWNYEDEVKERFSFDLSMRSSYPVEDFRLPQHPQAQIDRKDAQQWQVSLGNGAPGSQDDPDVGTTSRGNLRLDKDIVVYWRHEQGLPGAIDMVSYREPGSSAGTFMLTLTPGDDLSPLSGGRDWIFVLDYSGSMSGKYATLIEGMRKGLAKLDPSDRFRVILFNNSSRELTRGFVPADGGTVERYMRELESTQPTGGTNLYGGLQQGLAGLDSDRPSAVILVTDGVANVGVTEKKRFMKLLERRDVRLFTYVMGNSANRPLLEGMAQLSHGFSVNVSNSDDVVGLLAQTADKLNHQAYRDLDIDFDGVKVTDITPANPGTLYRGQQLTLLGRYWGAGDAKVSVSGMVAGEERRYAANVVFPEDSVLNPELERLWAFANIEAVQNRIDFLGEDADSRQSIVDMALAYGLVTNYTSLVVVRDSVYEQLGISRDNAKRIERERVAREKRAGGPVQSHRQDTSAPAFGGTRAYPSKGGGSMGLLSVVLLLPLLWILGVRSRPGSAANRAAGTTRRA